ncbi:MAG TPA: hypothetical protein VEX39_01340 [Thermoleophilaceae bacterium]|nr:hypothetical protein [Thermoleophilaceae bacterium]
MSALDYLRPLVGSWDVSVTFPGAGPMGGATTEFEFMDGGLFLVQRWTVPVPEAPDGIALIGHDEGRGTLLQHYFDTRGVARVYEMGFDGGVWTLERTTPDFSDLNFWQRFEGTLSEDGQAIEGAWQICHDEATWGHDFGMTYTRRT